MNRLSLTRETNADRINAVLNDPSVRPFVADESEGVLDISRTASDPRNVLLMGEHGGCMFFWLQPGVYEVHTQVTRDGRGEWTRRLTEACAWWMFTQTDAYEIVTRVPEGHVAAKTAARAQGMRHEFTRAGECLFRGRLGDVSIHSFRIQDWIADAPWIEERGSWFHGRLHAEAARLGITGEPHDEDPNHNRYVGAAFEMALAGQVVKAVLWYNRWAMVCRHPPIAIVQRVPLVIRFDIGLLKIEHGDIEVLSSC